MKPLPPAACAVAKHAAARATIGISTQFLLIQPCLSAKRSIRTVSQVKASPTNAPIPISSTTTQTTCPTVPPSTSVPTAPEQDYHDRHTDAVVETAFQIERFAD